MPAGKPKLSLLTVRNLLIASLALNVFLAGFIFARLLSPERAFRPPEPPTAISLRGLPQDIPPDVREGLEQGFKPYRREVERAYRDLIRARVHIGDLLKKEDLSPEELEAALKEVRELQIQVQIPLQEALIESIRHMNAEERRNFVLRMDSLESGGIWAPWRFDGARWQVELQDGKVIVDLKGFENFKHGEDEEEQEPSG